MATTFPSISAGSGADAESNGRGAASETAAASVQELWVCWQKPDMLPAEQVVILSFLPPAVEDALEGECRGEFVRAREFSQPLKAEARRIYIDLVARIGTVSDRGGRTLRQTLASHGQVSRWWYHSVTFRNNENDPTFHWIIALRTIQAVALRWGAKRLHLVGAPWEVVAALRSRFHINEARTLRCRPAWLIWLRGIVSRLWYAARALHHWVAIRRWTRLPVVPLDVILSGFWDWSLWWDEPAGSLTDRYFQTLPDELKLKGLSVGWFAWLDPDAEPGKTGRSLQAVLEPLGGRNDVVLLQSFLSPRDILRAVSDFGPAVKFLTLRKQPSFKAAFLDEDTDYSPLFSERLLSGFIDIGLSHNSLVALATERAARHFRPKVSMSFLENFLYSRAHYEGFRRSGAGTVNLTVQHCVWSHEKIFLFLHPSLEFRGEPDGCPVPHADYVCAMGTLGQELFVESGYPKDKVLLTGSPRYDHIRLSSAEARAGRNDVLHVLIVSSLYPNLEMNMVEAVCAAAHDLKGVKLYLRNHPFSQIERHPRFAQCRDHIEITQGSLMDDLDKADLIIFSYSTVAEEAILRGKPVWQWLLLEFNASPLSEAVTIPRFGSVARLRQALLEFRADPSRFLPDRETQELVFRRLFFPGDGEAAKRIATECVVRASGGTRIPRDSERAPERSAAAYPSCRC